MENYNPPSVDREWLASYWRQNPRRENEDIFQYNFRLMQQVAELLRQEKVVVLQDA